MSNTHCLIHIDMAYNLDQTIVEHFTDYNIIINFFLPLCFRMVVRDGEMMETGGTFEQSTIIANSGQLNVCFSDLSI